MTWFSSDATAGVPLACRTKILFTVLFAVAAARVFIVLNLPLDLLSWAGYDDALFMRLGSKLALGHWLGGFNQLTLVKGPGYPLFLAVTSLSGLPLSATHALFQVAAISVTAWAVFRLTSSRAFAALVFIFLIFCPVGLVITRVLREQIYWAQSILVFSLAGIVLFAPPHRRIYATTLAVSTGLMFGWAWLTREEGLWFVPGFGLLGFGAAFIARNNKDELLVLARNICLAAIGFLAVNAAFRTGNLIAYGSSVGVDVKEHNFVSALEALQSVEAGPIIPHVRVSTAVRAAVADISPTFAPLNMALLPGAPLASWMSFGCEYYKQRCDDYVGDWFVFAFRDAAAVSGFYASPKTASDNFRKIADEIAAACSDGKLRCGRSWVPYVPRMTVAQWRSFPRAVAKAAILVADRPSSSMQRPIYANDGLNADPKKYWSFLNHPRIAESGWHDVTVTGWYYDSKSTEWPVFTAFSKSGSEIPVAATRQSSPDLQRYFSDDRPDHNRFQLTLRCPDLCDIAATTTQGAGLRLTLDRDEGLSMTVGNARLFVDSVSGISDISVNPGEKLVRRLRGALVWLYHAMLPFLLLAGLVAAFAASVRGARARVLRPLLVMALAAWLLVATRILLLALIDVSLFPVISLGYSAAGNYLAIMAAFFSIAAFTWGSHGVDGRSSSVVAAQLRKRL